MSTLEPPQHSPNPSFSRDLDQGCRLGFLALTAPLAYISVRLSLVVWSGQLASVYHSLLKGAPLPFSTNLVTGGQHAWLLLSMLLPSLAITLGLSAKRPLHGLLIIAACNMLSAAISLLLLTAMFSPFSQIMAALT